MYILLKQQQHFNKQQHATLVQFQFSTKQTMQYFLVDINATPDASRLAAILFSFLISTPAAVKYTHDRNSLKFIPCGGSLFKPPGIGVDGSTRSRLGGMTGGPTSQSFISFLVNDSYIFAQCTSTEGN
jgi:hypothetical protein